MLIYRAFIFLSFQLFLSCNALRCTTECSFSSSLTTPVKIPDRCNQIVSANRCYAAVIFSYHRGEYYISLQTDPSKPALVLKNRRYVLLKFLLNAPTNFSYTVEKECSDRDDCARELIAHIATDIFRRQLDYSTIVNEVYPLVIGSSLTPDDPYLKCYGSNQTVEKCITSTIPPTCLIIDLMLENRISFECGTEFRTGNAFIQIYQTDDGLAELDVYCNRSLCNTHSTLQAVKELMYRYRVTTTPDGLLASTSSQLAGSTLLMIMIIFSVFYNYFLIEKKVDS